MNTLIDLFVNHNQQEVYISLSDKTKCKKPITPKVRNPLNTTWPHTVTFLLHKALPELINWEVLCFVQNETDFICNSFCSQALPRAVSLLPSCWGDVSAKPVFLGVMTPVFKANHIMFSYYLYMQTMFILPPFWSCPLYPLTVPDTGNKSGNATLRLRKNYYNIFTY